MKYVSDSNLSKFLQKLKGIFAKKSEVPSQADVDSKLDQTQADARYLQLSGGTMTGSITTNVTSVIKDFQNHDLLSNYTQWVWFGSTAKGTKIVSKDENLKHTRGAVDYDILDTSMGLPYTTTAPSSANTDGIKIVVLSSEPATRYDGWLYIILGS